MLCTNWISYQNQSLEDSKWKRFQSKLLFRSVNFVNKDLRLKMISYLKLNNLPFVIALLWCHSGPLHSGAPRPQSSSMRCTGLAGCRLQARCHTVSTAKPLQGKETHLQYLCQTAHTCSLCPCVCAAEFKRLQLHDTLHQSAFYALINKWQISSEKNQDSSELIRKVSAFRKAFVV